MFLEFLNFTLIFLMHGQIAQAADACTLGFGFFSNDHNNLTPSNRSIILFKMFKIISLIKIN